MLEVPPTVIVCGLGINKNITIPKVTKPFKDAPKKAHKLKSPIEPKNFNNTSIINNKAVIAKTTVLNLAIITANCSNIALKKLSTISPNLPTMSAVEVILATVAVEPVVGVVGVGAGAGAGVGVGVAPLPPPPVVGTANELLTINKNNIIKSAKNIILRYFLFSKIFFIDKNTEKKL